MSADITIGRERIDGFTFFVIHTPEGRRMFLSEGEAEAFRDEILTLRQDAARQALAPERVEDLTKQLFAARR